MNGNGGIVIERWMTDDLKLRGCDLLTYAFIFSHTHAIPGVCVMYPEKRLAALKIYSRVTVGCSISRLYRNGYIRRREDLEDGLKNGITATAPDRIWSMLEKQRQAVEESQRKHITDTI